VLPKNHCGYHHSLRHMSADRRVMASCSASATRVQIRYLPRFDS
jgi:hypothetical protein